MSPSSKGRPASGARKPTGTSTASQKPVTPGNRTKAAKPNTARTIFFLLVALALVAALFLAVPESALPWVKALHVFVIIAWMAGMLYLPRLFVYHTECGAASPQAETFKIMERRLLKGIMTPSMLITWVLGLWLGWKGGWFAMDGGNGWIHAKIALVVVMSGLHGFFAGSVKRFARGELRQSAKFWRLMNEVPAVVLAIILVLVVVKPF